VAKLCTAFAREDITPRAKLAENSVGVPPFPLPCWNNKPPRLQLGNARDGWRIRFKPTRLAFASASEDSFFPSVVGVKCTPDRCRLFCFAYFSYTRYRVFISSINNSPSRESYTLYYVLFGLLSHLAHEAPVISVISFLRDFG